MMRLVLVVFISFFFLNPVHAAWFRGNTHTHTNESGDGDATPQKVVNWYASRNYDFVVLTDHNTMTEAEDLTAVKENFLIIQGEEITQWTKRDNKDVAVHVIGIGLKETIDKSEEVSVAGILKENIDAVSAQGGIAQINHPNYYYSLNVLDFLKMRGALLFELYNGSSGCLNDGDLFHVGLERMWDLILSHGKLMYGVAADDAHDFIDIDENPSSWDLPGKGWVVVNAKSLKKEQIMGGLRSGNFYSSNGVNLKTLMYLNKGIYIEVQERPNTSYWIRFIGKNGKTLKSIAATSAFYEYTGKEKYVRATIVSSDNRKAWTQPQFLR